MDNFLLVDIDGMAYRLLQQLPDGWWFVVQDGGCNIEIRKVTT